MEDINDTPDINRKLLEIVPDDPNKAYDVKEVINNVVDREVF